MLRRNIWLHKRKIWIFQILLCFSKNDQLFLETLLMNIRGKIISFSSYMKKGIRISKYDAQVKKTIKRRNRITQTEKAMW